MRYAEVRPQSGIQIEILIWVIKPLTPGFLNIWLYNYMGFTINSSYKVFWVRTLRPIYIVWALDCDRLITTL